MINIQQHDDERGQTMILMALLMSVITLLAAFVVDGGFGLVQMRQAQNAADTASVAAANLMPCSTSANSGVTGDQVQKTIQALVDQNVSGSTTSWTAQYLDVSGNAISGQTFSNSTSLAPPSNACGVSVQVKGSWTPFLAQTAGYHSLSAQAGAGAVGNGGTAYNLAIASLLPYARHTIYAGSLGQFQINGSIYDSSVAQCSDRTNACTNYPTCSTGTPVSNILCYGDSADVFEQSTETVTGTIYSVAPVAIDPCFYQAPTSGNAKPMTSSQYPLYYFTYGCGTQFSQAQNPMNYGGMQGNVTGITDPLANLPDPSNNSNAGAICPGQTSAATHSNILVSSGTMTPGVYTNTVVITGSVTLAPCQSNGVTTAPGIYIFQKGVEICPASGKTVTGSDVMLYNEAAPASTASNATANGTGYCASAEGANGTVTDGIEVGGAKTATVSLTAPTNGPYDGIALYQRRSTNLNIGMDDGWTHTSTGYTANGANVTVNGVVYDNSFSSEPSGEVFSAIGSSYGGPYSTLCGGATATALDGDPVPCPGIPSGLSFTDTTGAININGAVIVGAFCTTGGASGSPLKVTITYDSSKVPTSVSGVRLVF